MMHCSVWSEPWSWIHRVSNTKHIEVLAAYKVLERCSECISNKTQCPYSYWLFAHSENHHVMPRLTATGGKRATGGLTARDPPKTVSTFDVHPSTISHAGIGCKPRKQSGTCARPFWRLRWTLRQDWAKFDENRCRFTVYNEMENCAIKNVSCFNCLLSFSVYILFRRRSAR